MCRKHMVTTTVTAFRRLTLTLSTPMSNLSMAGATGRLRKLVALTTAVTAAATATATEIKYLLRKQLAWRNQ
ncbi:hypothetical protein Leryth_002164 [Lithospermum erythrorhizon]|nr:hypothetical protein Leryth_002164 [Lithospermum erythrorhizon]